jgi:hypothetical protein
MTVPSSLWYPNGYALNLFRYALKNTSIPESPDLALSS